MLAPTMYPATSKLMRMNLPCEGGGWRGLAEGPAGLGGTPNPHSPLPGSACLLTISLHLNPIPIMRFQRGPGWGGGRLPGRIKGPRASDFFPEDPGPQVPFILQAQEPWTPGPSSLTDPHVPPPRLPLPLLPAPASLTGAQAPACPSTHEAGGVVILHRLGVAKGLQDRVSLKKLPLQLTLRGSGDDPSVAGVRTGSRGRWALAPLGWGSG